MLRRDAAAHEMLYRKRMSNRLIFAALWLLAASLDASAQVPMEGTFLAEGQCSALQSIRRQTNPGDVATEPGRRYKLVGRNADEATHYYILVEGAEPARRWIGVECGRVVSGGGTAADTEGRIILAASWHAAFCETRPESRDCRGGGEDDGFSLHGLWPQPRGREYCGVERDLVEDDRDGAWHALPDPELSVPVQDDLERVMPGTAANLHRHEWIRHGTCYGTDAEDYFADSVALVDALNASAVGRLFAAWIGQELSARDVRAAFDAAFGSGAGERVALDCVEADGRRLIGELRIALAGTVSPDTQFSDLILAAEPVAAGCQGGEVDANGFR